MPPAEHPDHALEGVVVGNLEAERDPRVFLDGSRRWVQVLPSMVIGKGIYRPGWRWSSHAGPQVAAPAAHHVGLVESGQLMVRAADGSTALLGPGDCFEVGPGHDAWVVGDQPCVAVDFEALAR